MSVHNEGIIEGLIDQFNSRADRLMAAVRPRALNRNTEGAKRGSWVCPDMKRATKGSTADIQIAVDDFKTILAQMRKL